eukprot:g16455.t1
MSDDEVVVVDDDEPKPEKKPRKKEKRKNKKPPCRREESWEVNIPIPMRKPAVRSDEEDSDSANESSDKEVQGGRRQGKASKQANKRRKQEETITIDDDDGPVEKVSSSVISSSDDEEEEEDNAQKDKGDLSDEEKVEISPEEVWKRVKSKYGAKLQALDDLGDKANKSAQEIKEIVDLVTQTREEFCRGGVEEDEEAPAASQPKAEDNKISVQVRFADQRVKSLKYKLFQNKTKFALIIQNIEKNHPGKKVTLTFDGDRIEPSKTSSDYDIDDNDQIDANLT